MTQPKKLVETRSHLKFNMVLVRTLIKKEKKVVCGMYKKGDLVLSNL
jgi:hypothetical protein